MKRIGKLKKGNVVVLLNQEKTIYKLTSWVNKDGFFRADLLFSNIYDPGSRGFHESWVELDTESEFSHYNNWDEPELKLISVLNKLEQKLKKDGGICV